MRLWLNADTLADRFDIITDLTTGNGVGEILMGIRIN